MQQTQFQASYKKHVEYLVLEDDKVAVECAILRKTPTGDTFYLTIESLDGIDRSRLVNLLSRPNSHQSELWEIMMYVTLNNGVNALEYFHQLVYVKTASGAIMKPAMGRTGAYQVGTAPKQVSVAPAKADTVVQTGPAAVAPVLPTPEPSTVIDGIDVAQLLNDVGAPPAPPKGPRAGRAPK